jgi:nitrite reductase/ring-hydroxylating ferredoxin subunit
MPSAEIPIEALTFDTPHAFEWDAMKVVVVRTREGIHAFEDACPHAFWPLSAGTFRDGALECPGHGWEFQVRTGKCLESPAYCLNRIAVTIDGEVARLEWQSANSSSTRKSDCAVR